MSVVHEIAKVILTWNDCLSKFIWYFQPAIKTQVNAARKDQNMQVLSKEHTYSSFRLLQKALCSIYATEREFFSREGSLWFLQSFQKRRCKQGVAPKTLVYKQGFHQNLWNGSFRNFDCVHWEVDTKIFSVFALSELLKINANPSWSRMKFSCMLH